MHKKNQFDAYMSCNKTRAHNREGHSYEMQQAQILKAAFLSAVKYE